jgi:hypothetical protein
MTAAAAEVIAWRAGPWLARYVPVDRQELWAVIEDARADASGGADVVAARAASLLAPLSAEQIVAAAQLLWNLMADSYRGDLWAAAYLINGGASDDGFEYFRGWLIAQGREAFNSAVADPDSLATLPAVQAAAAKGEVLEGEPVLGIAWDAYLTATGQRLPPGSFTISYPPISFGWDFDDDTAMRARLPRLARLFMGPSQLRRTRGQTSREQNHPGDIDDLLVQRT